MVLLLCIFVFITICEIAQVFFKTFCALPFLTVIFL